MNHATRIGVNLAAPEHIPQCVSLVEDGVADYIELLIDNFLCCDPASIRARLGDIPVALHIMASRFIERDELELAPIAARIRRFIVATRPLYVSDHLARHTVDGLPLPMMCELDYEEEAERIVRGVTIWQNLLDVPLLLENIASLDDAGHTQPAFLAGLIATTGCGALFDVSNAVVAERNIGLSFSAWRPVWSSAMHFHIGGYSPLVNHGNGNSTPGTAPIWIDSHDRGLANDTFARLAQISVERAGSVPATVTVEYDHDIDVAQWIADIERVRELSRAGHISSPGRGNVIANGMVV